MNTPDTMLEIRTLGCFSISINGKPLALDWPDESLKVLFCSLLSPLDLYITYDRICRSMLGVPATRTSRRRLEEILIRPLNSFLIKALGFNPLVTGHESIRIDLQRIHVDALEFHNTVVGGLRLLSLGDHAAALEKLSKAHALYAGIYLPGMQGKIIESTRNDLESLFRTVVIDSEPGIQSSGSSGRNRRAEPGQHYKAAGNSTQALEYGLGESIFQGYRVP